MATNAATGNGQRIKELVGPDAKQPAGQKILIQPLNMRVATFRIRGTSPYVQNAMSAKAQEKMRAQQAAGSQAQKERGRKREAKNFEALYQDAMHKTAAGWHGIPCAAFRSALIDVCRTAGVQMTMAKMCVFVEADGHDAKSGTPLVRIAKGEPHYTEMPVRNDSGVIDLRARPMWESGWEATIRVRYDADFFTEKDVANLVYRAGAQVGVGEGRAFSKDSHGCGWGFFEPTA